MSSGYSQTPLAKKLGLKEDFTVRLINPPPGYLELFDDFPRNVQIEAETGSPKDFIHFFTRDVEELQSYLGQLRQEIKPNGIIWVSWPKKRSKIATNITEDVIRDVALAIGLVDVKVCAVNDVWSGLKLVIPLKDRK